MNVSHQMDQTIGTSNVRAHVLHYACLVFFRIKSCTMLLINTNYVCNMEKNKSSALSSKITGLKFMQRAAALKAQREKTETTESPSDQRQQPPQVCTED
jgi:hypothetical protein